MPAGAVGKSGQYWFGFSPSNIPGLALWYDFSDTSTFDLSGDYVITRVRDKSGNGRHGTASNGAGGYWIYDGVIDSAIRQPANVAVNFVLDVCLNASDPFFSGAIAVTGVGTGLTYFASPTGAGGLAFRYSNTRYYAGTTASVTQSPTITGDTWSTSICSFTGGSIYDIVANGVGEYMGSAGLVTPPQVQDGLGFKIGTYTTDANRGAIHELLLFSNTLSATDRAALDNYLVRKWMKPLSNPISSPTNIPGCTLWLDTSGAVSNNFNFATGSNVIKWKDKSGNNYDVSTVGTTTYPVWTTTDTSGLYFPPGAVMNTNVPLPPTGEETAFIVGTKVTNSVVRSLITATEGSTGPSRNITSFTAGDYFFQQNNGSAINSSLQYTSGMVVTGTRVQLLMWRTKGSEVFAKISGQPSFYSTDLSTTSNTVGFTTLGPAAHGFREVITYNRALTWDEMSNMEVYLFTKWGLSNTKTFASPVLNTTFTDPGTFARAPRIPDDIPGCMLWLDAKDSNSLVLDANSRVITWYDKSGFRNDLSSIVVSGITRPIYSNETVTFNSNRMDIRNPAQASSNFIMYPGLTNNDHTFIALHKPLTVTGSNVGNASLFDFSVLGSPTCNVTFPAMGGTTPRGWTWSGNAALSKTGSTLVENSVETDYNIISASISSLRQVIYKNGIIQNDLRGQSISTFAFNTTISVSAIGRFGKNNSSYYQGDVKELFVFDRALTRYEINRVESYLATKWNLTNLLPADHMVFSNIPVAIANVRPPAFADAIVWLDAMSFASNHSNNQNITANWSNLGNNSVIRFVRSATPVYLSNAYRGRPGINLTTGSFYASNGLATSTRSMLTYAMVSRSVDSTSIDRWIVTYGNLSTSGPSIRIGTVSGSVNIRMTNSTGTQVGRADNSSFSDLFSNRNVPFLIEAYGTSNRVEITVNGQFVYDVSSFPSVGGGTFGMMGIGRDLSLSTATWPGRVHEILLYDNPNEVSDSDRVTIRSYLMNKWGVPNLLPTYYPNKGTRI
jgi:hypothetical protein